MRPVHHKSVTTYVNGVTVICTGVEFWPYEPATLMDPPEPPMVSWGIVFIGGVEVQELFTGELGKQLEDVLISQLER